MEAEKKNLHWHKLNGEHIADIKSEVEQALLNEKGAGSDIRVCIGTDSQVRGNIVEFATVIVFLRKKRGGFMYINNFAYTRKLTIKERMLIEVANSIDIAYQLCDLLDTYNVHLEVHADINTNPQFESNVALKEAMGYIMAMGFDFKAKPDAFASTSCANKVV